VTYAYSVKAIGESEAIDSDFSNSDTGWRASSTTPTSVAATDGGSTTGITLTWNVVAGTGVSYKIFRADFATSATPTTQIASSTSTSYADTTAEAGKVYVYGVKAVGASGAGDSPMSVPDTGYRAMGIPGTATATNGTEEVGQGVLIAWPAVAGASSYEIAVTGGPVNATFTSTTPTYPHTAAIPGTLYTYKVRALGPTVNGVTVTPSAYGAGDSGWAALPVTTWALGAATTAAGSNSSSVVLNWNDLSLTPAKVTRYTIYRAVGSATPTAIGSVTNTVLSYADTSAVTGVIYNYYIKASGQSGTGDSEFSTAIQGWRPSAGTPSGVAASDGSSTTGVTVSWVSVAGTNVTYKVFRGIGSASTQIATSSTASYVDTTAEPGTVYTYGVKAAVGTAGDSPMSGVNTGYRGLAAPTSVAASDGSSTASVTVTWVATPGVIAGYDVYRGTSVAGGAASDKVATVTGLSCVDTTAVPGTLYTYSVRAKGSSATVLDSAYATANAGWRALSAPTLVSVSQGTSPVRVEINWSALSTSKITKYTIYRAIGSATPTEIGSVNANVTSFADTTGVSGTTYRYAVRATGATGTGDSDFSAPMNGWRAPVSAPTSLAASDGTSTSGVTVSWQAVTGSGVTYTVFRGTGSASTQITPTAITETSYTDTSAVPGTIYTYAVKAAVPDAGQSLLSSADTGYRALVQPSTMAASDGTSTTSIALSWTVVPGATSYQVYRNGTALAQMATSTYVDSTPTAGQLYTYAVRALGVTGVRDSDPSVPDTGWRALSPPTAVAASQGASASSVTVSWTSPAGSVSTYTIYRAIGSAAPTVLATVDGSVTSYLDLSGSPSTKYMYSVKASGDTGTGASAFSAAAQGWRGAITAPLTVAASDGTSTASVSLTWSSVAGATSYKIFRGTTSASTQIGTSATASFTDNGAAPGILYVYGVKASSASGDSVLSATDAGYRALPAPATVSASDGTSTVNVQITWTSVAGAANYDIYRGAAGSTPTAKLNSPGLTTTSFTDTKAITGVAYAYAVKANGASGVIPSVLSASDVGWRSNAPPSNALATTTIPSYVRVSWSRVTTQGVLGYTVYRGPSVSELLPCPVQPTSSATTSIDDTSAIPGVMYVYAVAVKMQAGESAKSNTTFGMRPSSLVGGNTTSKGSSGDENTGPNSSQGNDDVITLAAMGVQRYLQVIALAPDAQVLCSATTGTSDTDPSETDTVTDSSGESEAFGESEAGESVSRGEAFIDLDSNGRPDICQLLEGDLNLDGTLDQADVAELLLLIGELPISGIGDVNLDGVIDMRDVAMLTAQISPPDETPEG